MKRNFVILAVVFSLVVSACATPGLAFSYSEPILAAESSTFVGTGLDFARARASALANGINAGYSRIVAEIVETEGTWGQIQVTLVMLR